MKTDVLAKAFYELYSKEKAFSKVVNALIQLQETDKSEQALKNLLLDPALNANEKFSILENALPSAMKVSFLKNFLGFLLEKNEITKLFEIGKVLEKLRMKESEIENIKLFSANKISRELKASIKELGLSGEKTEVEIMTDPSLLAGFVLESDDYIIDNSLKKRLQSLKSHLLAE